MKKYVFHGWKGFVFTVAVFVVLVSAAQVFGTEPELKAITLSATVRDPAGSTGTVDFTFELEEMPAASAVLPNYSTISPEPSAVPEPSTLLLVGLGVLGLGLLRKIGDTR